jgi:hypothetical protein
LGRHPYHQKLPENREKQSGETDEQWFANVSENFVVIFSIEKICIQASLPVK